MPATSHERRVTAGAELRLAEDGRKLVGHAAVFNTETVIGRYFREVVRPGAFKRALTEGQDVRATLNHDPGTAFARSAAGTLRLTEDDRGLAIEADLNPDDPDVQRMRAKLGNGTWSEMSFAFAVPAPEGERWDESGRKDGMLPLRELLDVDLYDVAVVTYPAYPSTDASVRSAEQVLRDHQSDRQEPAAPPTTQPASEQAPAEVLHLLLDLAEV